MSAGTTTVLAVDTVEGFGGDPWWLILLKVVVVVGFLIGFTVFNIWFERKVVARMQHRVGPNRAGPFGTLQSLADGLKLQFKEDITPKASDRLVFILAPMLTSFAAVLTFAVIPFGPNVSIFGTTTALQITDFPVAVLFVLAIASIGIYGLVLGGWSSGSTYPLLGGIRSSAQMISYEIAMALAFVAVFMYAGSISTSEIVAAQAGGGSVDVFGLFTMSLPSWYAVLLLPSFIVYMIAMVGETNRAPFDLPEAEGELVGGFHTEYSSMKFASFFLAEYINMVTVSALATTLFLGGWRAPWPLSIWDGANEGWWPILWFLGKLVALIFFFVWLRGTLPRLRYDQFMNIGWKVLIPVSLAWIVVVAALRAMRNAEVNAQAYAFAAAAVFGVIFLGLWAYDAVKGRGEPEPEPDPALTGRGVGTDFDPFAGGYPVPPLPGQVVPGPVSADSAPVPAAVTTTSTEGRT